VVLQREDRSGQGIAIIFEDDGYIELTFGSVSPSVTGVAVSGLGGSSSGNMAGSYTQFGLGVKQDLSESLSIALILDEPYGAAVDYPSGTGYPLAGTTAEVSLQALTAVARYKLSDRISVHGGVRTQSLSGDVAITGGYTLTMDSTGEIGYLVGAAFEIPEIALRAAITYNSAVDTALTGTEVGTGAVSLDVTMPQSVNLDFQTGIAADTLLFGSVRWAEWTAFDLMPPFYASSNGGASLLDYNNDVITYTIGIGRRFSNSFSGSISLGYEAASASPTAPSSNLAPTDGFYSIQVGGKYSMGDMDISGGIRFAKVGDATTSTIGSTFADNTAVGVGVKVGYSF
jgi:long-chain fatty acid transport protein